MRQVRRSQLSSVQNVWPITITYAGLSLQATWIRNTILRAIREYSSAAAQRLPTNIVFQAPSISSLTDAVLDVVHNTAAAPPTTTTDDLISIAERLCANLPVRPASLRTRERGALDVVLITGTTGGFGCDALEHLLRDERVGCVYAFNRRAERQRQAFKDRGLDEALLDSEKFRMVETILHASGFGIEPALLDEVSDSTWDLTVWRGAKHCTDPWFCDAYHAQRYVIYVPLKATRAYIIGRLKLGR